MKVIDLLNKIANGEIEPNTEFFYKKEKYRHIDSLFGDYYVEEVLNGEVEIIEDKKIPEKLGCCSTGLLEAEMIEKINEIIDYLEDKQC